MRSLVLILLVVLSFGGHVIAQSDLPDASNWIVFADGGEQPGYDIFLMRLDGSDRVNLTNHRGVDASPRFSPDGERIVFDSDRNGNLDIYVMDRDGSNLIRLTDSPADDFSPTWSPDGTQIAFASNHTNGIDLYIMNANGSQTQNVTQNAAFSNLCPDWSPDGRKLLFQSNRSGNNDLYILDLETGDVQNVTDHPADDRCGSWSPDGERISFVSLNRDGVGKNVYVMRLDDLQPIRLVSSDPIRQYGFGIGINFGAPRWSPDGRWLLVDGTLEWLGPGVKLGGLLLFDTLQEQDILHVNGTALNVAFPDWQPIRLDEVE